jgi:hypothetical protein
MKADMTADSKEHSKAVRKERCLVVSWGARMAATRERQMVVHWADARAAMTELY